MSVRGRPALLLLLLRLRFSWHSTGACGLQSDLSRARSADRPPGACVAHVLSYAVLRQTAQQRWPDAGVCTTPHTPVCCRPWCLLVPQYVARKAFFLEWLNNQRPKGVPKPSFLAPTQQPYVFTAPNRSGAAGCMPAEAHSQAASWLACLTAEATRHSSAVCSVQCNLLHSPQVLLGIVLDRACADLCCAAL